MQDKQKEISQIGAPGDQIRPKWPCRSRRSSAGASAVGAHFACHAAGKGIVGHQPQQRPEAAAVRQSRGTDQIGIRKEPDEGRATGNGRYPSCIDPHELRWIGQNALP